MAGDPGAIDATAQSRLGAIFRATSGNFLEMFDFFLFGFYASAISKAFFPAGNENTELLLTFTTFWLGALMRPLGAIVLGAYIDRIGRRKGLIVTLAIMASGTVLIAFCPTYATLGLAAPIIVLIGRLLQGFSAGVEIGGVSIYLFEIATPGRRGFYTSFQSASQQVAIMFAALIGYVLNAMLTKAQIADFGWRIPFFIGCLIVPFIFLIRRSLQETQAFAQRRHHPTTREILTTVAANWKIVLLGMMLTTMTTVTFYMITVYTPTFGKTVLKLSETDSLIVTLCVALTNFIWLPVGGALSDAIGRKPVLLTISILSLVTTYPALNWLTADATFAKMLIVELWLSFFFGVYNGAMVVSLSEVVPAHVRASGFSLAYSLATALFGTATPLVSTYLIDVTKDRAAPSYWLMFAAACGILATLGLFRGGGQPAAVTDAARA
ncbi:MFS transporter [Methylobacterium persicinum]|uniref:MHS family citrate/tricarballylate:H+ symporter-like MFS transporter n=1 Tax=Methylobacterium persicinum TaxID=374426 RepID=A0ABU0HK71_9HYPH|nr:MFS transporter [Methylobacterium persicinum]MDQ0442362.1 MHS family citrate/tricarballylate:H+ symporter-like MFS transporter [Methylobacterium persicinum]GJE37179.1 Proline/betaine transporter [Methylobacterium persicinum]